MANLKKWGKAAAKGGVIGVAMQARRDKGDTEAEAAPLASWVPAGWYTDPLGLGAARYWDGSSWSGRYRDAPPPEPLPEPPEGQQRPVLDDSPMGDSSETAEPSKRETVAAGPDLKSLGFAKALMLNHVSYYGGWSEHPLPEGKSNLMLRVDKGGMSLRKLKTIFTIPWQDVADITIEGPEAAERRFTATRLIALNVVGLAFKKDKKGSKEAIVTVTMRSGDDAIFHVAKTLPREIEPKLIPIAIQVRMAAPESRAPTTPVDAAPDIAEQIEKLTDLFGSGALTEDEFKAAKARLLGL